MDTCIAKLDHFDFKLSDYNWVTLNSTFELYKSDIIQIFKLFQHLLASVPHILECQPPQWDITSFVADTSALMLATYNTIQISKCESSIEAQKQKTDLLADIICLHCQHLHKLDDMINDISNELKTLKVQTGFLFSIIRVIAQVISDSNKLWPVVATFE